MRYLLRVHLRAEPFHTAFLQSAAQRHRLLSSPEVTTQSHEAHVNSVTARVVTVSDCSRSPPILLNVLILDDLGSGLCYHEWALRLGAAAGDGRWLESRFRIYKRHNYIAQYDYISALFNARNSNRKAVTTSTQ